ncbi:MAG TPA: helicase-exonuclease AddAB subunit AddA [Candidatus Anaerostipes excrementavium]|uniref:DNA 3'-5' helicase n=1 Tax=Candidatus Anaerostipes excrementavium TaxID=2838463 RepID=A0A9D2BBB1_9FIRM|nr:helicase-exonuclease AddAB subunit AddA [uncultured Anaerostipes sp.]HIX69089.1 helicase-exonuclease AddAB subunit AddA [Candidatus Anaerostipes excrementavium]
MPWTKEQQKVIDQRDADILVSAAAGSGKTAVLVERIIQKITDEEHPLDVDRLLVVTYTKAAAGEMRERIEAALDRKVQENPGNHHFVRQLSLIHKAQITTIHSFCMNLIRDYFYVLGIDPNITPGEEGQLSVMREEVLDEILEEAYEKRDPGFIELVESYSPGRNDQILGQYVMSLYQKARSHVRPEQWLSDARENLNVKTGEDLEKSSFIQTIWKDAGIVLKSALQMIQDAVMTASMEGGPYFYLKQLKKDEEIIGNLAKAPSFGECCRRFESFAKPRLSGRKKKADVIDERLQERCKDLRTRAYKLVQEMQGAYFYRRLGELLREMKIIHRPLDALITLTEEFMERYSARKIRENVMDYDDMEHFALRLLIDHFEEDGQPVPSRIALEKADDFEEIYIDEYQDSNFIQDAILKSVSQKANGGHNMFMVGDVKQSIYSFRLARPELFLEKYEDYQHMDEHSQLIELRNNFRSRREVLDFVNDVFYEIMHASLGNIEYTEDVALVPTMEFLEKSDMTSEILLIDQEEAKQSEEDQLVLEARMAARKIHEIVDGPEPLMIMGEDEDGKKKLRKAEYRDIVILLRSMKGNGEIFQKELMDAGIPAFCSSQKGYFDTVEIRTLLSLLSAVDNIYLDIDLAAVLRSPIIGMDEEELGWLKAKGKKEHLYDCLMQMEEEMEKAGKALDFLRRLREAKTFLPLHELLWMALDESGYFHYAGSMPQGKKRQGNILMLVEQAKAFENRQVKGLFHFVRFIEQCKEYEMDFGEANVLGEDQNLVHISSIHKSKGLEYPIVFVSNIHKRFNLMDSNGSLIFHPDYFIGADLIDPVHRTRSATLTKSLIRRQMRKEALGEELRVLYVAMTRAKEKLFLTGIKKGEIPWEENRHPSYIGLLEAGSYYEWLAQALPHVPKEHFHLQLYGLEDLAWLQEKEEIDVSLERQIFFSKLEKSREEDKVKELWKEFSYQYANLAETKGQLKYSVSEIKRMSQAAESRQEEPMLSPFEEEPRIPKFISGQEKVSAVSRGTAIHKVFELLDMSQNYTYRDLDEKIHQWVEQGAIDAAYDPVIRRKNILAFLQSDLGKRIQKAAQNQKVSKEKQFVMGVPFSEMADAPDSDSYVVVQGIIDLYFEEEDGLVLVDYKTDRISQEGTRTFFERYQTQLDYYRKALEQMTGKNVKECYIYSVYQKRAIVL